MGLHGGSGLGLRPELFNEPPLGPLQADASAIITP